MEAWGEGDWVHYWIHFLQSSDTGCLGIVQEEPSRKLDRLRHCLSNSGTTWVTWCGRHSGSKAPSRTRISTKGWSDKDATEGFPAWLDQAWRPESQRHHAEILNTDNALCGPMRDTPHIAQYLFEIISQRGVLRAFALFSQGIAQVLLRRGRCSQEGGEGIAPNWPCWDTKKPIAHNRAVSLSRNLHTQRGGYHFGGIVLLHMNFFWPNWIFVLPNFLAPKNNWGDFSWWSFSSTKPFKNTILQECLCDSCHSHKFSGQPPGPPPKSENSKSSWIYHHKQVKMRFGEGSAARSRPILVRTLRNAVWTGVLANEGCSPIPPGPARFRHGENGQVHPQNKKICQ